MKYLFIVVLFLLFCISGFTQNLALSDAINIALKNSLDIELAKNNLEINSINNNIGVAGGLPVITANGGNTESVTSVNQKLNTGGEIKRNGATVNNLTAGIAGSILLYNGQRVIATKKRLEQLQQQSQQYVTGQVQNIMAAVMTGYFDVVRQQNYIKTIDQSIAVATKKLDIIKVQQNVGLANNADLFQAQVDVNNLIQTKQSQLLIIEQAKAQLLTLLTLKPDSLIQIQDTILIDKSIVLKDILNNISNNPDVIAAEIQIKINQLLEKEIMAQQYPSVRANAGYNYGRNQASAGQLLLNQNYGPFVGLSLTVPIYNGSVFKRQQRVAEINTRNTAVEKQILLRNYTSGIVKTYQAYASGLVQLETAQKNVQLSQQLLNLIIQRFQLRQATIVELTLAQQSFQTAGYNLINISYAAKAAEIELKRVANRL